MEVAIPGKGSGIGRVLPRVTMCLLRRVNEVCTRAPSVASSVASAVKKPWTWKRNSPVNG